jgi:hypothetical protein
MKRTLSCGILVALATVLTMALGASGASAANGDQLRQIIVDRSGTACASYDANGNHSSVGTGIAFDGTNLLMSCWTDNKIVANSPADGSQVSVHTITGGSLGFGALAWDNSRQLLWACDSSDFVTVGTIDLVADTFTPVFQSQGCIDGLAYDGTDDTLWSSADASSTTEHYTVTGTLINSYSNSGLIGGCGNSGIAVGGSNLYLANNGCSEIYTVAKDFSTSSLFSSFPRRLEDLECDNLTFAGQGKGAIWSQDAYDNIVNAWEIPPADCQFGGGSNLTLEPATASNNVGTSHTVTATLKDSSGNPVVGATILFSVSGANSASGSDTTDSSGQATFTYTGTNAGGDTITACYDKNTNTQCDVPTEPTATATKTWTQPPTPCTIKITNGGWIVTDDVDRASFGGVAKETSTGTDSGNEEYQDHGPADPMNVHSLEITDVTCDNTGTQASIFGNATVDGTGSHAFQIDVQDNGEPGKGTDHYRMRIPDIGYDSGDHILRGGNVQIH